MIMICNTDIIALRYYETRELLQVLDFCFTHLMFNEHTLMEVNKEHVLI